MCDCIDYHHYECDGPSRVCDECGGALIPLGQLSSTAWYRCRACGLDQQRTQEDAR